MNYWLVSPEICLLGFAVIAILLDLVIQRKGILAVISIIGLAACIGISAALWVREGNNTIFGGMLVVDKLALFFKFVFCGAAILVVLASQDYVSKFPRLQGEYYALILLSAVGMMLMAATRELISIYISLELTSLSLYALVGFLKDPKSSEASLKYLLLGAVASAVLLYGMVLVFGLTGQTHLDGIYNSVKGMSLSDNPALIMGLVFLVAGFGFKIASIPFQMWVPDVYEGAPTPITAYLSVASKAAGFAVILNVFLRAFGEGSNILPDWAMLFAVLSAISMTIGNVVAISQTNIKRMLGYSSIAQAGYLMVGLAAVTVDPKPESFGPTGLIFFIAGYAAANLGAFIAIIAISNKINSDFIADYSGMGKRAPLLALALTLCLISLTGLPPTVGFLAKFYLFTTAVHQDLTWLVIIAVLNTAISAYYYFRVIKVTWFGAPASAEGVPSSWALRLALAIACLGVLVLFFLPSPLLNLAQTAARVFSP